MHLSPEHQKAKQSCVTGAQGFPTDSLPPAQGTFWKALGTYLHLLCGWELAFIEASQQLFAERRQGQVGAQQQLGTCSR